MADTDSLSIRPIRVLGMGNVLLGDDAVGPYVVRLLEARYRAPEGVEIADVGTPGLDLTPHLAGAAAVVVVDTVAAEAAPGTVRTYRRDALLAAPPLPRTSPHEPGLREALLATELTDSSPDDLLLVGVVPEQTDTGAGLSPTVRAAADRLVELVIAELERLGRPLVARDPPLEPDIWWE